jgi:hypothetical protein
MKIGRDLRALQMRRSRRGQAALEVGLVMLPLFAGVVWRDRFLDGHCLIRNSLIQACREGTRYESRHGTVASYFANSAHNGRRVITVIVNNGLANSVGTAYSSSQQAVGLARSSLHFE